MDISPVFFLNLKKMVNVVNFKSKCFGKKPTALPGQGLVYCRSICFGTDVVNIQMCLNVNWLFHQIDTYNSDTSWGY